jgi:hypothetical protein
VGKESTIELERMVRLHKTEGCSRYGASADRRGSHFDLVIIALLFQTDQISPKNLEEYAFIGELSLDGRIRPCSGVLPRVTSFSSCSPVIRDAQMIKISCNLTYKFL